MENAIKRPYKRCLYGNYKMDHFEEKASQNEEKGLCSRFFGIEVIKALRRLAKMALLGAILLFSLDGCKPEQIIVEKDKLVYVTKDSIVHRDSTVYVPVEVYKDYALDTLVLRTSLAESKSWLDTSSAYLVGEIRNLKAIEVKYIEVDKWHTKDSIVEKEVPKPYQVVEYKVKRPWWAWICLTWTILSLLSIGWAVYKKIRP